MHYTIKNNNIFNLNYNLLTFYFIIIIYLYRLKYITFKIKKIIVNFFIC